jgi:excisionase family DNA binding protein
MATYSTAQVADLLGIGTDTLHRWIKEKKVPAPNLQLIGGVKVRLWSEKDVETVKKYKLHHYWGRGSRRSMRNKKK